MLAFLLIASTVFVAGGKGGRGGKGGPRRQCAPGPDVNLSTPTWPETAPCRPSFMVIGAPKSGSTSLFKYLEQHPEVKQPARKELCFFSEFKRSLQRYCLSPASSWPLYTRAFAGRTAVRRSHGRRAAAPARRLAESAETCEGKQAFEGCPFYLGEHKAAVQLRVVFPALRAIAVLRNPRERTISAFNDYVRMGRIQHTSKAGAGQRADRMAELVENKVGLVRSGARGFESFDVRLLTSGVYIHGLRKWGDVWPAQQLLVLRAEDMFTQTASQMARVRTFLGLRSAFSPAMISKVYNNNAQGSRAKPLARTNSTLDVFFAPFNAQLYAWCAARGVPFAPWPNASAP